MTYSVKEIFKTLQGEGGQTGRVSVFCRFAGCNLWSGRESDRVSATCQFCDTDFVGLDGEGGGKFETAEKLALAIATCWGSDREHRMVVFTGGEPLLQLDDALVQSMKAQGFFIAVETNGTIMCPDGIDWICVSPKAGAQLVQRSGTEIKLVFPQEGIDPADLESLNFNHFFLQPMDGTMREANTNLTVDYCIGHPKWRMSMQTHKFIGIP